VSTTKQAKDDSEKEPKLHQVTEWGKNPLVLVISH